MPQPLISVHGYRLNDQYQEEDAIIPLAEIERAAILSAVEIFHGRRDQAAKALGISEKTLSIKLEEYGAH